MCLRKIFMFILLFLLLGINKSFSKEIDISLGTLVIGMSKDELVQTIGSPLSIDKRGNKEGWKYWEMGFFKDTITIIWINNEKIIDVSVSHVKGTSNYTKSLPIPWDSGPFAENYFVVKFSGLSVKPLGNSKQRNLLLNGFVITSVKKDSSAYNIGLREGMTIFSINGHEFENIITMQTTINKLIKEKKPLTMFVKWKDDKSKFQQSKFFRLVTKENDIASLVTKKRPKISSLQNQNPANRPLSSLTDFDVCWDATIYSLGKTVWNYKNEVFQYQ